MATVSITVPDALIPRLRAAMRNAFPEFDGLSDTAAFKAATADYWRNVLSEYEQRQAEIAAQLANVAAIKAAADRATAGAAGIS